MKKIILPAIIFAFMFCIPEFSTSQGILDKIKSKTKQRADNKVDNAIDKGLDKVEDKGKTDKNNTDNNGNKNSNTDNNNDQSQTTVTTAPTLKAYQNYDFVPGDKILFEDHFTDDQDGEFPSHWELVAGQGQLNKIGGEEALFLTQGNYVKVKPRMKTEKYLTDPFTIEYDYYQKEGAYGLLAFLNRIDPACDCESSSNVQTSSSEASFEGAVSFSKNYATELQNENFNNKWHHVAIAVKNHQLKVYVDQNRVLVVPDTKSDFYSTQFGGIGDDEKPLIFKNVRIASGGNMNMIGKKFTEAKIVTHGINFDIDKSTIKPESMGTLNMVVQVMKDNPDIEFEVDGHTDNTGTATHNLALSQQRAEAVKAQLINMGIDASRLSAKGFGDTKPISDNTTLEGKGNNRRVEFVKM